MTNKEQYFIQQLSKNYNDLAVEVNNLRTQVDTLFQENISYQNEIARCYEEIGDLKGAHNFSPALIDLEENPVTGNLGEFEIDWSETDYSKTDHT